MSQYHTFFLYWWRGSEVIGMTDKPGMMIEGSREVRLCTKSNSFRKSPILFKDDMVRCSNHAWIVLNWEALDAYQQELSHMSTNMAVLKAARDDGGYWDFRYTHPGPYSRRKECCKARSLVQLFRIFGLLVLYKGSVFSPPWRVSCVNVEYWLRYTVN